ncbi:MAG: cytochrome b/b6 domain-containing protein [Magnetovibrio sp.]|nr:cytochrome b/b6 domain-containing protein [Magnetovibrio sp.]
MSIIRDNASRYGVVSQILHWGLAGLIIFTFISGQIFEDAARADKAELMNRHATLAILLMAFLLVRAVWHTSQSSPDDMNQNKFLILANKAAKLALYAVPVALATSGDQKTVPA